MTRALRYAYNTNGMANHRLEDAFALLADTGYSGVALTLDHHHFDPFGEQFESRLERLARTLEEKKLGVVIETGARFLLDPRQKHQPTLLSPDPAGRALRVAFLKRAIEVCARCGGEAMSFWAGVPGAALSLQTAHQYLREGLEEVLAHAEAHQVVAALEPEPGMLVETVNDYLMLRDAFPTLKLALDTGHVLANEEGKPDELLRSMRPHLGTVAIEDMKRGVHEHLYFGHGDMDFTTILRALIDTRFGGLVCIELSRDSHRADQLVPSSIKYLEDLERRA